VNEPCIERGAAFPTPPSRRGGAGRFPEMQGNHQGIEKIRSYQNF
jgi:hypothetical protein